MASTSFKETVIITDPKKIAEIQKALQQPKDKKIVPMSPPKELDKKLITILDEKYKKF